MAAGRSKRMKPIEDKNFLNFAGKPLIQHQLELLHESGLDDVVVVGGEHNMEKIRELGENLKMSVSVIEQEDLDLGMCGAILSAKNLLADEPVVIFSSNDVVEKSAFESIKKAYEEGDASGYLLGYKVSQYFPGGYLETDSNGFISNIVEKPGEGNEPSDLVNLVVHMHKDPQKLISYLEKTGSDNDDKYEVALAEMMRDGVKFKAVEYDGFWHPVKFPWHVQKVFEYYFDKADKFVSDKAQIAQGAVVKGDVIIEEGVKIFEGAIVNGPCYIGKNTVIANNALVRGSNIGADCVIGFSTEVARSYLGSCVWTHSNYIGDSVIENNVSFGAGTVIGNLRLDECEISIDCDGNKFGTGGNKFGAIIGSDVRVGVNTSFMPGVKVGKGSFVGAGIVIAKNIPKKSFVRGVFELKISENKCGVHGGREEFKKKL